MTELHRHKITFDLTLHDDLRAGISNEELIRLEAASTEFWDAKSPEWKAGMKDMARSAFDAFFNEDPERWMAISFNVDRPLEGLSLLIIMTLAEMDEEVLIAKG